MKVDGKKKKIKGAAPSQRQLNSLLAFLQDGQFVFAEMLAVSLTQEFPKKSICLESIGCRPHANGQTGCVLSCI